MTIAQGLNGLPLRTRATIGISLMAAFVVAIAAMAVSGPVVDTPDEGVKACAGWYAVQHGSGHLDSVAGGAFSHDEKIAEAARSLETYARRDYPAVYDAPRAMAAATRMTTACTAHGWYR